MSKKDEALKLALEALEYQGKPLCMCFAGCDNCDSAKAPDIESAVTALREALNAPLAEQPAQQEPAFYRHEDGHLMTPSRAEFCGFDLNELQPLYTSPPTQRTWVGLSERDRDEIIRATERDDRGYVMALVEAKLKEKNT